MPPSDGRILDRELAGRHGYAAAFASMTFGSVLLLDFYAGHGPYSYEILPDLFAYLLAAVAGKRLMALHPSARPFFRLAVALVPFALLDIIIVLIGWHLPHTTTLDAALLLATLLHTGLQIALVWHFIVILIDLGTHLGIPGITARATTGRNLFIAYALLQPLGPFVLGIQLAGLFTILLGSFATASLAFLCHRVRRALLPVG